MAKVIALVSIKGGVGKTSIAMNLAAAAAQEGRSVGALDLDPQGSLRDYAHERKAGSGLAHVTVDRGSHPVSSDSIRSWASGFDVAVLDCPPQLGPTSRTAARVATAVVIPIEASPLSLYTVEQTIKLLAGTSARRVVVLARAMPNLAVYRWAEAKLRANAATYGYQLAPRPIVYRPALYTEMVLRGEAAVTLRPDSSAAEEVGELLDLALNRATETRKPPALEKRTHGRADRSRA